MISLGIIFIVVALVLVILELTVRGGSASPLVWAVLFIVVALLLWHVPALVRVTA